VSPSPGASRPGRTTPPRPSGLGWLAVAVVVLGLILIGIGIARGGGEPDPVPEPPTPPTALAELRVALDPGHNGGNAAHPEEINALVPDGRGATKPCNTVGTATLDGYPEHAFTWDVAQRTRSVLTALGATVLLTRDSDDGVGPCVDERGTFGQDNDADLVVSIHADGSEDRSLRGYFAIVADPPLHPAQAEPSRMLAAELLDALDEAGFTRSPSYPGGLSLRADLAGLNHAERPVVLLELGEMRNAEDAALMASVQGRQRFAEAITRGIAAWADRQG
jgi:N-acetylmuramoyl-L-alanine amidase